MAHLASQTQAYTSVNTQLFPEIPPWFFVLGTGICRLTKLHLWEDVRLPPNYAPSR